MSDILIIDEVAARLRVSVCTITRWMKQTRDGQGTFPLPLNAGRKGLWTAESIDNWIAAMEAAAQPVIPVKAKKCKPKIAEYRREHVRQQLEDLRPKRKTE